MATGGDGYIIVAALDFGTAFSGYAFSFRHAFQSDPTKIAVNTWSAGTGGLLSEKTTTCALFDPKKKFHSFGFEAEDKYSDLALEGKHLNWYFFKHFKMDLYVKMKLNREFKLEDITGRSMPALDIFSCSIRYLKDHLLKTCRDQVPDTRDEDVRWVLTVPAIWGDAAKQFMREAASKAGIKNDQLQIALEPEAASVFCKYLPIDQFSGIRGRVRPFQPGSKYMVLDAGGGTVDITVHKVNYDDSLSEIYKASGGNWGGTYVDKAFKTFLSDIIGDEIMKAFVREQTLDYIELFRTFEVKKRTFKERLTDKVMFKVPVTMNETLYKKKKKYIKDVLRSKSYGNNVNWASDKLRVTADIVNSFFDEPCKRIVEHLEKLFSKDEVKEVDFILMVGGFAESLILQECIRSSFPERRVIIPNEPGLAVLKGAVIFGHDTKIISERKAKYTYGVSYSVEFVHGKHPEEKKQHVDGNKTYCRDVFHVHVQIGRTIRTGESLAVKTYRVKRENQTVIKFPVYVSKKRKPTFVTDEGCIHIGTLRLRIPGFGLDRRADLQLIFGGTELHVQAVDLQTGGEASASFDFLSGDGPATDDVTDVGCEYSNNDDDGFHPNDTMSQNMQFLEFKSEYGDSSSSASSSSSRYNT